MRHSNEGKCRSLVRLVLQKMISMEQAAALPITGIVDHGHQSNGSRDESHGLLVSRGVLKEKIVADVRRRDALKTVQIQVAIGWNLQRMERMIDGILLLRDGQHVAEQRLSRLIEEMVLRFQGEDVRVIQIVVSEVEDEIVVVRRFDEVEIEIGIGLQAIVDE